MDAFYFVIITASSIGYGDILPVTWLSRLAVVLVILMILYVFSEQISKLSETIREADIYDTHYKFKDHIILLGTHKVKILSRFLLHFYKNPYKNAPKCILIGEKRINNKLKALLSFTLFEDRVVYLSVKSIDKMTLAKAAFIDAKAIFYLCD